MTQDMSPSEILVEAKQSLGYVFLVLRNEESFARLRSFCSEKDARRKFTLSYFGGRRRGEGQETHTFLTLPLRGKS